jgi:hypothetical protein
MLHHRQRIAKHEISHAASPVRALIALELTVQKRGF